MATKTASSGSPGKQTTAPLPVSNRMRSAAGRCPTVRETTSRTRFCSSGAGEAFAASPKSKNTTVPMKVLFPWVFIKSLSRRLPSSSFEQLHRLLQAAAEAIEGRGEHTNLVLAGDGELRDFQIASTDFICRSRHANDGANDHHRQTNVEHHERQEEDRDERRNEGAKGCVGLRQRHRHGNGDDLRADDLIVLPAETIRGAVLRNHRGGCPADGVVANQTLLVGDFEWPRTKQRRSARGLPDAAPLVQVGIVAELVHDVCLPFHGLVARVGWIERCLFVTVLGIFLTEVIEDLGGGVRRHRLWEKDAHQLHLQLVLDL